MKTIPMRGTRWLLLVAIVAILSGLGLTYRARKQALRDQSPATPEGLPSDLNAKAQHWSYTETNSNHTTFEITAEDFREVKDTSRVDLKNVVLKLYSKKGDTYDLVKSAAASYFKDAHRFYSDGQVDISLALPKEGEPKHTPISIQSSGVSFDTNSGQADTDRPSSFAFENGTGSANGAFYDPATHVLNLKQNVKLDWKPVGPHAKPMQIEAGSLYYREADQEIWLKPWGKLTRDKTVVEGQDATVKLQPSADGKKKTLKTVEALQAHGVDEYPKRKLQYSAASLKVDFNEDGQAEKVVGDGGAHLVSTSDTAETTMDAQHVNLDFDTQNEESVLTKVAGEGAATVTSKPLAAPGRQIGETHVLRSEKLDMTMRPGGREIERVSALAPGTLEFLPNAPAQRHRTLTGKDMLIAYAAQNRIESFRAADVRTETEPTAEEKKRNRVKSVTTSKVMEAKFDPKTDKMTSIEQTGDFTYEEGDRKARAAKGSMDAEQNVVVLDTGARMADATGMTSANRIRMDQRTGDFTAEGNVQSSRMPEKDQRKNSEMLSGDEPLHAQARRMDSANRNRKLHYEGSAVMWQGANRIQADTIDLDRERRTMVADGHVVTNLWEEPKDEAKKKAASAAPVLTEVRAPRMVYTEADRQSVYTGGATLKRPNLDVTGSMIRAFLADTGTDSRLDRAYADGGVRIRQSSKAATYNGTSEHSEYYMQEQKVLLTGGMPTMVDGRGQKTVGPGGLTYWVNDDRLVVNGAENQPATSLLQKGKKK